MIIYFQKYTVFLIHDSSLFIYILRTSANSILSLISNFREKATIKIKYKFYILKFVEGNRNRKLE